MATTTYDDYDDDTKWCTVLDCFPLQNYSYTWMDGWVLYIARYILKVRWRRYGILQWLFSLLETYIRKTSLARNVQSKIRSYSRNKLHPFLMLSRFTPISFLHSPCGWLFQFKPLLTFSLYTDPLLATSYPTLQSPLYILYREQYLAFPIVNINALTSVRIIAKWLTLLEFDQRTHFTRFYIRVNKV